MDYPRGTLHCTGPTLGICSGSLGLNMVGRRYFAIVQNNGPLFARSGFCSRLNQFKHRIGASDTDLCPDCRGSVHSTNHLFECNSNRTGLTTNDLWERPRKVVDFLRSCTNFRDLQDPGPSPPPPPRPRRRARSPPEPPP